MSISILEEKIYCRQMMMEGWGVEGQDRLKKATVFIAGAGALGSPAAIYLAVAGIGHLRICDFDSPDWSNLNRQILHDASRIGANKALSARITLERLNGQILVTDLRQKITDGTIDDLVADASIIIDCMDNMEARHVLNRCAIRRHIPLVHGSACGMEGRLSFLQPPHTPCLQCFLLEAPPKEIFPVVGAVPGMIGALQALEAIKYLTGIGALSKNKLLIWDGRYGVFETVQIQRDPACPACRPAYEQPEVKRNEASLVLC